MPGRPKNSSFDELHFILQKEGNKYMAICRVCHKTLKNTASTRLRGHRNICILPPELGIIIDHNVLQIPRLKKNSNNVKVAQCLNCDKEFKNVATKRCQAHRYITYRGVGMNNSACNTCTQSVKNENSTNERYPPNFNSTADQDNTAIDFDSFVSESLSEPEYDCFDQLDIKPTKIEPPPEKKIKISSFISHPVKIEKMSQSSKNVPTFSSTSTSADAKSLDLAVAYFIYSSRLSFDVVDSKYFKDFVKAMRPDYTPPTSKELSTKLLDKVYEETTNKQKKNLKDESVLLIDAHKDELKDARNVMTVLNGEDGKNVYLDNFSYSLSTENQDDFNEIITNSVDLSQNTYKTKIYAAVSNIIETQASAINESEDNTKIWHNVCSIHGCNLLIKDIIDKDLVQDVNRLLKDFKQTKNEKSLIEAGGHKIILPPSKLSDNWYHYRDSFQCILDNIELMKEISADNSFNGGKPRIEFNNKRNLFNQDFIENIRKHIDRLDPICDLLKKLQSPSFTIADATEEWINLKLPDDCQDALENINKIVLNKYGFAANILHPTYRGVNLNNDQRDKGEMFIFEDLDANGLEDYQLYCSNSSSVFETLAQKGKLTSKTFWGLASRKHASLGALAKKILQIPASSVQNKRIMTCSLQGSSETSNAFELDFDRSKKLLFIQYYLDTSLIK